MKKSHRVAHENQRRGGFCYYHYTTYTAAVKIPFLQKKNTSFLYSSFNPDVLTPYISSSFDVYSL